MPELITYTWIAFVLVSSCSRLCSSHVMPILSTEQLARFDWTADSGSSSTLLPRTSCPTDASLNQCGGQFPSDFCCPTDTYCLALNTTTSTTAALCCPLGSDCEAIGPVDCLESLQNATSNPTSQLHAEPPTSLNTCGSACCPMGYTCENSSCKATADLGTSTNTPISSQSSSVTALPTGSSNVTPSSASTAFGTASPVVTSSIISSTSAAASQSTSSTSSFSGTSFVAGFLPGIAIGALVASSVLMCLARKKRKATQPFTNEKGTHTSDTLTDLDPGLIRRPTTHWRSISEPIVDPSLTHRTDFLNSGTLRKASQHSVSELPLTEASTSDSLSSGVGATQEHFPRIKALFSHSPFLGQGKSPNPGRSPVPPYLKRGTISSFQISPVRGLRKQRSTHSLRRHMTDGVPRSQSSRRYKTKTESTGSTETIKVLMDTPDVRVRNLDPDTFYSPGTENETQNLAQNQRNTEPHMSRAASAGVRNPFNIQIEDVTPTRLGRNPNDQNSEITLGTPYTPSNYPKIQRKSISMTKDTPRQQPAVSEYQRPAVNRDTTFSSMMEQAGLTRSILFCTNSGEPQRSLL